MSLTTSTPVRALLLASLLAPASAFAGPDDADGRTQLLVDLKDDTTDADEAAIEQKLGGLDLHLNSVNARDERFFVADVRPEDLQRLIDAVKDDPRVENVEQNFVYEAFMVPDDPMFERQWSFKMVNAPSAWDHANGKGVTVAVIDTGVAYKAKKGYAQVEDLAGTAVTKGYDFVNDDDDATDDHGHGTHVAGTIAQTTNNGVGVAGLAFGARIMPIKVLDRMGRGMAADIADAIRYAADEGAQVINMSLGGGMRSLVMESAVKYARQKGVVVVCAAGNAGRGTVEYPARYPGAFAVSAVGPDRQLAFYSSWGKEIAIAAPGGDKQKGGDSGAILQNTLDPQNKAATAFYGAFQGTSMATPHVAAAAALVISAGVTDPSRVEQILRETASDAGPKGRDDKYGDGILDAGAAVEAASNKTHGFPQLLAGLVMLAGFALRRGRDAALKLGLGAVAGTVMGASGLWFLSSLIGALPFASFVTEPVASWDLAAFGAGAFRTALWASAIPFFALATVALGAKRWRGLLIGLALGWAAHLLLAAILMPADVQLIPGVAGVLDRVWLALNAAILAFLAVLIGKRPS